MLLEIIHFFSLDDDTVIYEPIQTSEPHHFFPFFPLLDPLEAIQPSTVLILVLKSFHCKGVSQLNIRWIAFQ